MIEAVGWQYFAEYFRRCSELLEPHGLFFLQAIAVEDGAYEAEKRAPSFANELIFPGGCLPSLEVIQRHIAERHRHADDLARRHQPQLRARPCGTGASASRPRPRAVEERGYDERFRRLWELWLALRGWFREARIVDVQLVAAKPGRPAR